MVDTDTLDENLSEHYDLKEMPNSYGRLAHSGLTINDIDYPGFYTACGNVLRKDN